MKTFNCSAKNQDKNVGKICIINFTHPVTCKIASGFKKVAVQLISFAVLQVWGNTAVPTLARKEVLIIEDVQVMYHTYRHRYEN